MEEIEFFDPWEKNRKWILLGLIALALAAAAVFYSQMPEIIPLAPNHYISKMTVALVAGGLCAAAAFLFALRSILKNLVMFPAQIALWWLSLVSVIFSLLSVGVMTLQSFRLPDYAAYLQQQGEVDEATPLYITDEAYLVAQTLNKDDFLMGIVSDTHIGVEMKDQSSLRSAQTASQGLQAIHKRQPLDAVAMMGDYTVADDIYKSTTLLQDLALIRETFLPITQQVPSFFLQGNHDTNHYAHAHNPNYKKLTQQEAFENLGAHNTIGTVDSQNPYGNYGFADFEEHKIRVIWLNTCDSEKYEIGVSVKQLRWLTEEALDVTGKENGNDWSILILSHHPLDWNFRTVFVTEILEDYQQGKKDEMPYSYDDERGRFAYDFSHMEQRATVVANIHGHVHNFTSGYIGDNGWLLRVSVPNASVERNNQYNNDFAERDENGEKVYWPKEPDSENATSFCVLALDTQRHVLRFSCFGAGYDREYIYRPYQK